MPTPQQDRDSALLATIEHERMHTIFSVLLVLCMTGAALVVSSGTTNVWAWLSVGLLGVATHQAHAYSKLNARAAKAFMDRATRGR